MTSIYLVRASDTDTDTTEHAPVTETCTAQRAAEDVAFWYAYGDVIEASTARTIATLWHSPGSALSTLSHGMPFDVADVLDAVATELAEVIADGVTEDTDTPSPRGGWDADDLLELRALEAWLEAER